MSDNKPRKPRKKSAWVPDPKRQEEIGALEKALNERNRLLAAQEAQIAKMARIIDALKAAGDSEQVSRMLQTATKANEEATAGVAAVAAQPLHGELAKVFGENLRMARLEARLRQDDLSQLSGISRRQISQIESGANATLATIEQLAPHVGRTPLELLTPRLRRNQ